ncbi:MAG TPA: cyclic nucleotide-binding domain-containing protein [Bdellovibrionales bacterium]|nr:cyclic nucleotide-binding domain-containing protein [Bdellovibrionales bacterium]
MSSSNLLQNVYLFKELTPKELETVAAIAQTTGYNPGDEVFSAGDEARSLYVIKHGSVKIQHSGKNESINVATLGTGSHFGEMAFVDGEKRSATVSVIEKGELVSLDFQDLRRTLDANPAIAVKVYRSLAHFLCGRLRITTTDLSFAREKNMRHF